MARRPLRTSCVVTGGAGFIGSHVVDLLVGAGYDVHVIDDLSTGDRKNVNGAATLHVADIRSKRVHALLKKIRPSAVAHLAAHIDLRRSTREPLHDADVNVMGTLNILSAAAAAGTPHIVFASTAAVYGGAIPLPAKEGSAGLPTSPYGAAKLSCEHYLHVFHHLHGMHAAALRFANVYGPRQTPKGEAGAVAIFMRAILAGDEVVINGDGEQTRDFVYVGDVAKMVLHAVEKGLTGTFNVSTGKETSVNALFEAVRKAAGVRAKPAHGPEKAGDERRVVLDPAKAGAAGWRAEVGLAEGISRTRAWFANGRRR